MKCRVLGAGGEHERHDRGATPGDHVIQIEVTFSDGKVRTWPSADENPLILTLEEGLDAPTA